MVTVMPTTPSELDSSTRVGGSQIFSGKTRELLFQHGFPDWFGHGRTSRVGDLDGDGYADVAIGDSNFHLSGPGDPGFKGTPVILEELTLKEALKLPSRPWSAFTPESGCLWIVSGRTREVMLGIYGKPGSREGIGLNTTSVPDVSGDGWPDLVVSGYHWNYVFPGPGNRVK